MNIFIIEILIILCAFFNALYELSIYKKTSYFLFHSCWQFLLAIKIDYIFYLLDFIKHCLNLNLYPLIPSWSIILINFILIKSFFNIIFEYVFKNIGKYISSGHK